MEIEELSQSDAMINWLRGQRRKRNGSVYFIPRLFSLVSLCQRNYIWGMGNQRESYRYVNLNFLNAALLSYQHKLRQHAHAISQGPTDSDFPLLLTLPTTTLAEAPMEIIGPMMEDGTIAEDYIGNIK